MLIINVFDCQFCINGFFSFSFFLIFCFYNLKIIHFLFLRLSRKEVDEEMILPPFFYFFLGSAATASLRIISWMWKFLKYTFV